jgi:hypothetical protein
VSVAGAPGGDPDLRDFVVATVRTPVAGLTGGTLFTGSYLFPPVWADHTLRLLLKHGVNDLAASVEERHGLASGTLGRTTPYRAAAKGWFPVCCRRGQRERH